MAHLNLKSEPPKRLPSKAPFYRGIPSRLVLFASKAVSAQGWTPSPSVIQQLGAKSWVKDTIFNGKIHYKWPF